MTDLAIIIPSRGRPAQAARLVQCINETATTDAVVIVVVDSDDETLPDYDEALRFTVAHVLVAPAGSGHVGAINAGAAEALRWKSRPTALAKLDDDHWPVTRHWDAMLLAALDQLGDGIVYGNDLLQGANLPTAPIISASIVDVWGWMGPPELRHLYVDNMWRDVGRAAGCLRYVPEVVVEHRHALAGKAPLDEGYTRVNAPEQYRADGDAYRAWLRDPLGFTSAVAQVRALRRVST